MSTLPSPFAYESGFQIDWFDHVVTLAALLFTGSEPGPSDSGL